MSLKCCWKWRDFLRAFPHFSFQHNTPGPIMILALSRRPYQMSVYCCTYFDTEWSTDKNCVQSQSWDWAQQRDLALQTWSRAELSLFSTAKWTCPRTRPTRPSTTGLFSSRSCTKRRACVRSTVNSTRLRLLKRVEYWPCVTERDDWGPESLWLVPAFLGCVRCCHAVT